MTWLYDIVYNKDNKIVALCFHQRGIDEQVGCLSVDVDALLEEDLKLSLSRDFNTLQEAKDNAWTIRNHFDSGLD